MKCSKYNFYYPFENDNNQILAYNSRTNALALLEKECYDELDKFINKSEPISDENFLNQLKVGQFVIDDNVNELELIRYELLTNKYSTESLVLTIAPTLNCNFDCVYCYEKENKQNSHMSMEVQNKILEFILNQASHINSLKIIWYGGEPLLELETIENLSQKIINICNEKNIQFSSGIVTNGYNLNRDIAMKLKSLNVTFMQVTLDGPEDIHDKRRPLIGGQGTFKKILKNLTECVDILDMISIRVNIDKENIESLTSLVEEVTAYGLKDKIGMYLGNVVSTNDCYSSDTCATSKLFSQSVFNFEKLLINKGFKKDMLSKYPTRKGTFCCTDSKNSYVIDYNGFLYKCWSDIGIKEYSIGSLNDTDIVNTYTPRLIEYLIYDPTSDLKCSNCKILPLCMGGCPKARIENNESRCSDYKYELDSYLKNIARSLCNV